MAAVVGTALLWLYLRRLEREVSGGERVSVLIALEALPRGHTLTEDVLATREVPIAYVEDRFIEASERDKQKG